MRTPSLSPAAFDSPPSEPNTTLLHIHGWSVITLDGPYCTAWKGNREVLLVWHDGHWQIVGGHRLAG